MLSWAQETRGEASECSGKRGDGEFVDLKAKDRLQIRPHSMLAYSEL